MQQTDINFHAERKTGIGGSDVAAILGLSNWKTPLDIYNSKLGIETPEEKISDILYFGKLFEPLVIGEYARRTNNATSIEKTFIRSIKHDFLIGHVDAWVNDDMILEAKTTRFFNDEWGCQGTDEVPKQYILQMAHYCMIANECKKINGVDLAVIGAGSEFRIYHYERNLELESLLINKLSHFWFENILKKIPPDPITDKDVAKFFEVKKDKAITASFEIYKKFDELRTLNRNLEEMQKKQEQLKVELQKNIGDAEVVLDADGKKIITWKEQHAIRLDQQKLKNDYKDIYSSCCKTASSRVFRVYI